MRCWSTRGTQAPSTTAAISRRGGPDGSVKASSETGRWVAAVTAACCAGRSAAKTSWSFAGSIANSVRSPAETGFGRCRRRRFGASAGPRTSRHATACASRRRCRARGSEEVDEQLVDVLGLVVLDPMRRVGQALDAVEVGDVLVVRLGQIRAEVAILLAPDHQGGRRDRLELRLGALR